MNERKKEKIIGKKMCGVRRENPCLSPAIQSVGSQHSGRQINRQRVVIVGLMGDGQPSTPCCTRPSL